MLPAWFKESAKQMDSAEESNSVELPLHWNDKNNEIFNFSLKSVEVEKFINSK